MRHRFFTKLRSLAVIVATLAVPATAVADASSTACSGALNDATFTLGKRRCYEELTARGRYQEVLDDIETVTTGISAQERFFLGSAYFGLANRTAAQSLRCVYSIRAKEFLEAFLVERQSLYRSAGTFGTSDDMVYVHRANKTLDAMKTLTGCEESAYTMDGLERYGRKYATDRVRGLFYSDGADELQQRFRTKIASLNDAMGAFVGVASQIESRTGLAAAEIEAARRYLEGIQKRVNGEFSARGVAIVMTEKAELGRFPAFAWDPAVERAVETDLDARIATFTTMTGETGEIGRARAQVLGLVNETNMDDYARHKEETIARILTLTGDLTLPINYGNEIAASNYGWRQTLDDALAKPVADDLGRSAIALDTKWRDGMRAKFCPTNPNRWYCKGGAT